MFDQEKHLTLKDNNIVIMYLYCHVYDIFKQSGEIDAELPVLTGDFIQ